MLRSGLDVCGSKKQGQLYQIGFFFITWNTQNFIAFSKAVFALDSAPLFYYSFLLKDGVLYWLTSTELLPRKAKIP